MAKFSKTSKTRLETCHQDLQILFGYVVQHFDCSIICGHRTPEEQFELYQKGRKLIGGVWTIEDPRQVVTYKNGLDKQSKHNVWPSVAIDAMPYPIEWNNLDRARYFAGYVKGCARVLKSYGQIEHEIIWGNDWDNDTILRDQDFVDIPHMELKL